MEDQLISIKNNAISLILEAQSSDELEELKIQLLGRNGKLTIAMKEIATLPQEKRPEAGQVANNIKRIIEETLRDKSNELTKKKESHRATIDVTEPGIKPELGHLHLVTQAIKEITSIFQHIGYQRVRYPEIEWDWYAFTALNFPEQHPARDDWETFFIKHKPHKDKGSVILTPHTSSGQVREMEDSRHHGVASATIGSHKASDSIASLQNDINIKMLNIAKCYRRQSDVSHTPMFHQFEGLVVGKNISISDLKGTLDYFVKSYFGNDRVSRIRPYHFQFTEPSFEVDISCGVCQGTGFVSSQKQSVISTNNVRKDPQEISLRQPADRNDRIECKLCKAGWLEIGGAGMVHPNVLTAGDIDPKIYTGFAFGWGVERVLMMKDGIKIDDLRTLYNNDIEFLQQF